MWHLCNSADTTKEIVVINNQVEGNIDEGSLSEISKIPCHTVKAAAAMMKKGKADVSGSYSSDAVRTPLTAYMNIWPQFTTRYLTEFSISSVFFCLAGLAGGVNN